MSAGPGAGPGTETNTAETNAAEENAAESDAGPFVLVDELRKRYGPDGPDVVDGINFGVGRGELFGLLGPNGAGKTTTIGVITTRVHPSGGRVLVDGIDVSRDPVAVKRRIAVVPQQSNLDRTLTAVENLSFHAAYFGSNRRDRRNRAREMLARFGLEGREDEAVNNYSGGMAQRLMLARALMHRPQLLVLDEPTSALDPQSRLFLWDTIRELRSDGVTILLTTHDMDEADLLCDRIAIVDHGKVVALDTPRRLRHLLPSDAGLDLVIEGDADPSPLFSGIEGGQRVEAQPAGEDRWRLRIYGDGDRLTEHAAGLARSAGRPLVELRRIEGTLEDVFVHLTGRELR